MTTLNDVMAAFRTNAGQDLLRGDTYRVPGHPPFAPGTMLADLGTYIRELDIDPNKDLTPAQAARIIAEALVGPDGKPVIGITASAPVGEMLRDVLADGVLGNNLVTVDNERINEQKSEIRAEQRQQVQRDRERANAPPPPETKVSSSDLSADIRKMAEKAQGNDKEALEDLARRVERLGQDGFTKDRLKALVDETKLSDAARYVLDGRRQEIFSSMTMRGEFPSQSAFSLQRAYEQFKPSGLGGMLDALKNRFSGVVDAVESVAGRIASAADRIGITPGRLGVAASAAGTVYTAGSAIVESGGDVAQATQSVAESVAPQTTAALENGNIGGVATGAVSDYVTNGGLSATYSAAAGLVTTALLPAAEVGLAGLAASIGLPLTASVAAGIGINALVQDRIQNGGGEAVDPAKLQALYNGLPPLDKVGDDKPELYSLAVYKDGIEKFKNETPDSPEKQERLEILESAFRDQYIRLRESGQLEQVEQDVAAMAPPVAAPPAPVVTQAAPAAPSAPAQEAGAPEAPDLNQQVAALAAAAGVPYPATKPKPPPATPSP